MIGDGRFTFDAEELEYLADVLDAEANRTALVGVNGYRGDLGAIQLAKMFRSEFEAMTNEP